MTTSVSEIRQPHRHAGRVCEYAPLILLVALALFLGPCAAYAQVLYGSLTGSITDPSQAVVPGATVEVLNLGTGVMKQTTSNERGIYLFGDLQPGLYKVTVTAKAFGTVTSEGLSIEANRVRRFDATLKVAQLAESVIVTAGVEALQTDRSDVNVNITAGQTANLMMGGSMGRNYQSLMAIVPGAVMYGEQNSDAGNPQRSISVNVNGVSRLQNNTKLDGVSIVYLWLPTNTAYVPSTEAIETINIVTNSYNAEQGMAGGAAVNLTLKSGTNDFHGTAWIFNIDSKFKARNFFQTTPQNPKNIINQFGLNFGGPVRIPKLIDLRNKLFFFVNWERTTRRQTAPPRIFSVAPQDLRDGNFAATGTLIYDPASAADPTRRTPFPNNRIPSSQFDVAAVELIKRLPAPTLASAGYVNNFVTSGSSPFNRDNVDIKVNQVVSKKLSYFGRYSISPHNILDPPAFGEAIGDASMGGQLGYALGRTQVAGAGVTYAISPRLLFDANLGFTRQRLGAQGPDLGTNYGLDLLKIPGTNGPSVMQSGMPAFQFTGWSNLGNANTGSPFVFRDNQYVANANMSWVKRTHTFRFGLDYWHQQINHFQPQGGTFQTARGTFTFDGNATALQNGPSADRFNSWAAFLLGLPSRAGKVEQLRDPNSVCIPIVAWYAQDQWQVARKLTVNLGVRWEYYPFPTRDWGGVSRFDPSDGLVYIGGAGSTALDTGVDNGKGQLVPRIGLAYRLDNKTVIRTGYGISVDPRTFVEFRNSFPINFAWEIPQATFNGVSNAFIPVTTLRLGLQPERYRQAVDLTQGTIRLQGGTGTTTVPKHAMRKYIQSWNFMLQRELRSGFVAQAGYVGTRAVGQMASVGLNAGAPGTGTAGRALYPQFGLTADINSIQPYKTTTYDGLQTQLTKRCLAGRRRLYLLQSHQLRRQRRRSSNPVAVGCQPEPRPCPIRPHPQLPELLGAGGSLWQGPSLGRQRDPEQAAGRLAVERPPRRHERLAHYHRSEQRPQSECRQQRPGSRPSQNPGGHPGWGRSGPSLVRSCCLCSREHPRQPAAAVRERRPERRSRTGLLQHGSKPVPYVRPQGTGPPPVPCRGPERIQPSQFCARPAMGWQQQRFRPFAVWDHQLHCRQQRGQRQLGQGDGRAAIPLRRARVLPRQLARCGPHPLGHSALPYLFHSRKDRGVTHAA